MVTNTQFKQSLLGASAMLVLAACGGGGGGGGGGESPPPPPGPLTLQGTAATGAAIAGAPVAAKCASGTGSTTTRTDGRYTISIGATTTSLPCVVEVAPAGGAALRSVAAGSGGGSATVNITPLTELVVARVARAAPASFFTSFESAKVTPGAVNTAIAEVAKGLQGIVDLAGANPITDTLVAANGTTPGNANDQRLDQLQAALVKAQSTFGELTTATVTSSKSMASVNRLVQPAFASCSGLRSGKYRILNPHEVGPGGLQEYVAHTFTVNASASPPTAVDDNDLTGQVKPLTPDAAQACQFTHALTRGDMASVFVTKSGVMAWVSNTTPNRTSLALPEQLLLVEDLAGSFNYLGHERSTVGAPFAPASGTLTVDASGQVTAESTCAGLAPCVPRNGPLAAFTANSSGGFNRGAQRYFAFQSPTGDVSVMGIDSQNASVYVGTKQAALGLPAVGEESNVFDFSVAGVTFTSTRADESTTVISVDMTAPSFTREREGDARRDTFTINQPRNGLRHRPASGSGAAAVQVMPLPGSNSAVYTSIAPADSFFGVALDKP